MLSPRFWPHIGGVETHVMKVSEELVRQGHEVTVLTAMHGNGSPDEEWYKGIRVLRFPGDHLHKARLWVIRNRDIFRSADVVHCHDFTSFTGWYAPLRLCYPKKPVFVTFHGHEGTLPIPKRVMSLRRMTELLTHGNICVGDYIPKWYGTKADIVCYGGTDVVDGVKEGSDGAVFIGRLEKDTGIRIYIEAMKLLKERGMDLTLDIYGDGSLRDWVEETSREHGLSVTVHGMTNDPWKFTEEHKFALVSGYLAILEAMARKKLVLSVYENELKEDYLTMIPNATDIMVIAPTAEVLAERIIYYQTNPSEYAEMVAKAHSYAKKNRWDRVAKAYLRLWGGEDEG